MKNVTVFCCVLFIMSCTAKTEDTSKAASASDTTAMNTNYDYPYTLNHPYNDWQRGDMQHAVNCMKSLKAFEMGNVQDAISYFGDTVRLEFDQYSARVSHDSLNSIFGNMRSNYTAMNVRMQDWESVISKDKKEEWVTLWYHQSWTDKSGKTDSAEVIDDMKIMNGKIVALEEAQRRYPVKK